MQHGRRHINSNRGNSGPGAKSIAAIGATINGVTVVDNNTNVPLFTAVPGYGLVGLRGAFRFKERSEVLFDFENIGDNSIAGLVGELTALVEE